MGEISETDNCIKALYEAGKIESKLAQRKMLGIVNPSLTRVDAIKQKAKNSQFYLVCKFCGRFHNKGECSAFGKCVMLVMERTTLKQNVLRKGEKTNLTNLNFLIGNVTSVVTLEKG